MCYYSSGTLYEASILVYYKDVNILDDVAPGVVAVLLVLVLRSVIKDVYVTQNL